MSWRHRGRGPSNTARWRRVRLEVFARDGWKCVKCGRPGRLECDHVVPMEWGGAEFDRSNLQSLCRGCHIAKTRRERPRKEPGPAVGAWRKLVESLR